MAVRRTSIGTGMPDGRELIPDTDERISENARIEAEHIVALNGAVMKLNAALLTGSPAEQDLIEQVAAAASRVGVADEKLVELLTDPLAASGGILAGKQDASSRLSQISALVDPDADRILFWDDSAGAFGYLNPSTGLTVSGTTITVRGSTEAQTGIVELASDTEAVTGTDAARATHPRGVKAAITNALANFTIAPSPVSDPAAQTRLPSLLNVSEMLNDTTNRMGGGDGAEFFTVLDVRGKITAPLDSFYGYVAGHDSTSIWLVTAPSPIGPWTWRQAVRTTASSTNLTGHVSSPEVIWWNGRIHLYYHGPTKTGGGQSTTVATSTNGVSFTEAPSIAIPHSVATDQTSYYAVSTTYARIADTGGGLAAVFQANNALPNGQVSPNVTTSIGYATSIDGFAWQISQAPLLTNLPGENGPFSPGIARVGSMWWVWAFFPSRGTVDVYASDRLEPGSFRRVGAWFAPSAPYDIVDSATIVWLEGRPHLYYGVKDLQDFTQSRVLHADLKWGAA